MYLLEGQIHHPLLSASHLNVVHAARYVIHVLIALEYRILLISPVSLIILSSSFVQCFATKQHLERHSNLHTKETLYSCPECDKVLLDKSYLLRHMRVHAELKPFSCNICQKKFRTACSLKRHETTHDPSSRPHVCPDCDKRFPDRSSLKKHSRIHAGVKTHVCIICAKGFCHVGDYNLHLKGHDIVKQYHCDQCGKEFARHNNLLRHKAVHSDDSNFQCIICKGCFQHASTLTRHILSCHPEAARVKKKRSRHTDSQSSGNLPQESISLEDGVSFHTSANVLLNASENDLPPQAKIVSSLNSSDHVSNIDKKIAICPDRCAENVHDAATVDITSNPPNVALSPSSFEIYQFDAHGTLVKMTDNLSFQVMSTCSKLDQPGKLHG